MIAERIWTATLAQATEILTDAGCNPDVPTDVHLIFLSDFGQDTWQDALNSGRAQRPLKQLAATHTIVYESFAGSTNVAPANVALMALTAGAGRALKDRPLDVELTVTNFGEVEAKQVPLQLAANGQTVASQFVDLPAGASRVVHLNVQPSVTGLMTVVATLPDDRLPADNQRQCVIEVRNEFKVLCVENSFSDPRILKAALQPPLTGQSPTGQSAMQVTTTSQLELNSLDLNEFDAIVLNDVKSLSEREYAQLTQFVDAGRSLVCLLGQNTDASLWNAQLGNAKNPLGFRLTEASEFADWRIDPLDYNSPIAAPFASHPDAGFIDNADFSILENSIARECFREAASRIAIARRGSVDCDQSLGQRTRRKPTELHRKQVAMRGAIEPWNAMATLA